MGNGIINGRADGARLRDRAMAALFFSGFGSLWMYTGLLATHRASPMTLGALFAFVLVLFLACAALMRRARTLPAGNGRSEDAIRARRMFIAVNIIQWVSVVTALSILTLLHMPEYAVPAIAIIVGLHLFPLAGSFHNRLHYITGACLLAWSLACLLMISQERMTGVSALGVGMILLVSAACNLLNFGPSRPHIDGIAAKRIA